MNTFPALFTEAWKSLRFHARRSLLTMLGIAWGIATVVLLLAYGTGFERTVLMALESFGTKVIYVFPGRTSQQTGGEKAGRRIQVQLTALTSGTLEPNDSLAPKCTWIRLPSFSPAACFDGRPGNT